MKKPNRAGDLFRDDAGFTTTSMVLSMLITLSLVFTAAQVYRIQSASAEVQDVADAAALSAQNQVAEYMLVARYCDAIVLSLTLTGLTVTGLGIVALCTPVTAEASEPLIEAGKKLISTRNTFSDRAVHALGKLQEALPYFSAACAASVSAANNASSSGASYLGVALLVPDEGEPLRAEKAEKSDDVVEETEENADEISDEAKRAEEASQEAERCKERAFMRDCGDNPNYCMYERAARLAGLSGYENPLYESVDAWSFGTALERAQCYYNSRRFYEAPLGPSAEEEAASALRSRFYEYAVETIGRGYVVDTDDYFDAYFPLLPASVSEMRETELYTEQRYPITIDTTETVYETEIDGVLTTEVVTDQHYTMHAWLGCPRVESPAMYGSVRMLDGGGFEMCPECCFTVEKWGNVCSASSYIENGFEYHYRAVAAEAQAYARARQEADPLKEDVKAKVADLIDDLVDAARESADKRISPEPPGRFGAIALVVNAGTTSPSGGFASGFVSNAGSLGPRAALAGATLLDEGSDSGKTVLNSALDNLKETGGVAVGAAGMVLDAWSWLVTVYGRGQSALTGAIEQGLNGLPLVGASGLGTWASEKLAGAIETVGLQPAEVGALKAVLVNSGHVAAKSESHSGGLLAVKQRVIAHPAMSTDLFSSVLTEAERMAISRVESMGDTIEIASIELLGEGGPSVLVTIPLPESAKEFGIASIQSLFGRIRSYYVSTTGARIWE